MSKVDELRQRMEELSTLAHELQKIVDETPADELKTSKAFATATKNLQRFCHEFGQAIDIIVRNGKLIFRIYPLSSVIPFSKN